MRPSFVPIRLQNAAAAGGRGRLSPEIPEGGLTEGHADGARAHGPRRDGVKRLDVGANYDHIVGAPPRRGSGGDLGFLGRVLVCGASRRPPDCCGAVCRVRERLVVAEAHLG